MSEKMQETIADIVAEMLGARTEFPFVYLMGEPDTPEVIDPKTKKIIEPRKINIRRVTVKELADRLEAALGREREASGNAAAMREALCEIVLLTVKAGKSISCDVACGIIASTARHALSSPPRNCDVGTAEEQTERYMNFCHNYPKCTGCPCVGRVQYHQCEFVWAQLPYGPEESEVTA